MKRILLTWVSSWIWNSLAHFLSGDYEVYWISRQDPQIPNIKHSKVDISDFTSLKEYLSSLSWISFDVLILNAWVWFFDEICNLWYDEIITTINTNLTANVLIFNSLLCTLPKDATIIFIWSLASKKFFKHGCVYQASKFWLRWFAWSLRNDIKQNVHILNPWFVDSKNFYKNSRLDIYAKHKETKIEDIIKIVSDILVCKEKRFEIDF